MEIGSNELGNVPTRRQPADLASFAPAGVALLTGDARLIYADPGFLTLYGLEDPAWRDRPVDEHLPTPLRKAIEKLREAEALREEPINLERWDSLPSGQRRCLVTTLKAMAQPGGAAMQLLILERDLTAVRTLQDRLVQADEELQRSRAALERAQTSLTERALTDRLTGLGNRRLFERDLEQMIASAERADERLLLVVVELERFQRTRRGLGKDVSTALVRAVGERLARAGRRSDRYYRLRDDMFVALCRWPKAANAEEERQRREALLQRVHDQICQPLATGGLVVPVRIKIRGAGYPEDGTSKAALLQALDSAASTAAGEANSANS